MPKIALCQEWVLQIHNDISIPERYLLPEFKTFEDSLELRSALTLVKIGLINKGYLMADIDSATWQIDTVHAYIQIGDQYQWAYLNKGNVPEEYLSKIGFRQKVYRQEPFSPKAITKLNSKLLALAENNGFPFAQIKLDSVGIKEDGISATLDMNLKQFTRIDSIVLKGNIKTSRRYLENYLGIKDNMPYNQAALEKIPARLRELPFVKVIKPYEIGMRPGKADVYLYLDNKKASNFDGIIGILPDDVTGKTLITGNIELNLLNSFKKGETINMNWQRLQNRTQQLDAKFAYPFLLGTPIGAELELNLYRRDTLFSQVNSTVGLQYFLRGGNYLSVFYKNNQANVISASAFTIDEYVDSRTNLFGVGINFRQLDYRFNPRRGYFAETSLAAGVKKIQKNPNVDDSEYSDIALESDIYNVNLRLGNYFPLGQRSTVLLRVNGGYLANDNLFRNEMYRIGGLKSLRGFNEQSIFASSYAIGTVEYRFILEQNSNFFVFFDQGLYEDKLREDAIMDSPFGFGAGINFETNAGVFSFTYALGKQFDNQIEIRSGKIHFGFISFF